MDTKKCIISKGNSIRFSNDNGLMRSFDNRLSFQETWSNKPCFPYDQIIFQNDTTKLLQIKAGLTATVVVKKYVGNVATTLVVDTSIAYTDHIIYEYLLDFPDIERFYLTVDSEESSHTSEFQDVIEADENMILLEWSNNDQTNNTDQFDYSTKNAADYTNYMRLRGQMDDYEPQTETTVYDNQNEKSIIKSVYYRGEVLITEPIPRQIAEIIIIASKLDEFHVNQVPYINENETDLNKLGVAQELSMPLTLKNSEGLNTDDIGFTCETPESMELIQNKGQEDATGSGTFTVTEGYGYTQTLAKLISGSPVLKIGYTVGGDEIFRAALITDAIPPFVEATRFAPSSSGSWTIYWEVTGGIIDLYCQTMQFNPQP